MAKLIIPTPLRKFTNDQAFFESPKESVKSLIDDLINTYQGLQPHLLDEGGNIRSFVRIYVGDEDIQALEGEHTAITSDTVVSIIPAIAGGSK